MKINTKETAVTLPFHFSAECFIQTRDSRKLGKILSKSTWPPGHENVRGCFSFFASFFVFLFPSLFHCLKNFPWKS